MKTEEIIKSDQNDININQFRIKQIPVNGFYIQRCFVVEKIKTTGFWPFLKKEKQVIPEWKNVDKYGNRPQYISFARTYFSDPLPPFKTKEQAIEYLEKICTPNRLYYPDKFE